ncbi:UbiA family prenyltransferase [Chitinophaga horti]|uniref:UbiA family prenyltransferase n=1 Tax=Chitinophaga horti TaxID=2920382 RepID=A0ABY6IVA1_9BACT|nr:UbiA family prenyltransferase [Chitinophaga horti]UYQ91296.1 UbiA family prenyltransferase [Chitinophaga horti]
MQSVVRITRSFFNFLLFSSLYIAFCAVAMTWQSNEMLGLSYDHSTYYAFVFFATICSYNFHWYLTPGGIEATSQRLSWNNRRRMLQIALYLLGLIGAVWFYWPLRHHWFPVSGAILLTFLYSAPKLAYPPFIWLRKIAIGKTLFLTFVWTYVTTVLPAFIADEVHGLSLAWLTCHRFFLIYAICILFDNRDREQDKAEGIRSLITYFDRNGVSRLYYFSVLLAAVFAGLLWPYVPAWTIGTLLVPVAVTAMIKRYSETHASDYVYYFYLDGLMMLSALLHYAGHIAGW